MYNGPIYNRRGQKIGELRSSALANPFACLIVALIPVALVATIIVGIFQFGKFVVQGISSSARSNQVNNAIEGGATHSFSESRTTGNVVVNSSGYYWLGNGASATFDINAHVADSYNLAVYVGSGPYTGVDVSVNGGSPTTMDTSAEGTGPNGTSSPIVISLQAGGNTITFSNELSDDSSCDPQVKSADGLKGPDYCTFLDKIVLS